MHTTRTTARTYERSAGRHWRIVRQAMGAWIGYNGLSRPARRHEGDATTAIGNYGFVYDFGSRPNSGVTGFRWRRLVPGSCWAGVRTDYNRWVSLTPCAPADEDKSCPCLPLRGRDRLQLPPPDLRKRIGDLPCMSIPAAPRLAAFHLAKPTCFQCWAGCAPGLEF